MVINTQETMSLIDTDEFRAMTTLAETSPYPVVSSITQSGYPEQADTFVLHHFMIAPPNLPSMSLSGQAHRPMPCACPCHEA